MDIEKDIKPVSDTKDKFNPCQEFIRNRFFDVIFVVNPNEFYHSIELFFHQIMIFLSTLTENFLVENYRFSLQI